MEIAEICARSGANCGSLFLDLRFRELVKVGTIDYLQFIYPLTIYIPRLFWPITPLIWMPHLWLILVCVHQKVHHLTAKLITIFSAFLQ